MGQKAATGWATQCYTLTSVGYWSFRAELERLQMFRHETLDQLRSSHDQQASGPHDTTIEQKRLQQIDADIGRLQTILQHATYSESPQSNDRISLGSTVTLHAQDQELVVTLVQTVEADPFKGLISLDSPLGQALAGKRLHETAALQTGRGSNIYYIAAIT